MSSSVSQTTHAAASSSSSSVSLETAASSILRSIDAASSTATVSAVAASREAEEARRNARAASTMAKKFMALQNTSSSSVFAWNTHGSGNSSPQRKQPLSPSHSNKRSSPSKYPQLRYSPLQTTGTTSSSSSERLSKANADAVVSLTLELDRLKHHLEAEQSAHDETLAALSTTKARNAQLEAQMETLLETMETQRETHGRQVDAYEQELSRLQVYLVSAQEDAQLAVELAKQNNDSRKQVEECLELTLQQVHRLERQVLQQAQQQQQQQQQQQAAVKQQQQQQHAPMATTASSRPPPPPPKRQGRQQKPTNGKPVVTKSVRFADDDDALSHALSDDVASTKTPPPQAQPPAVAAAASRVGTPYFRYADVAAGRKLLERVMNNGTLDDATLNQGDDDNDATTATFFDSQTSIRKQSQRLQEQLRDSPSEGSVIAPSSVTPSSSMSPPPPPPQTEPSLTALQNVSNLLRASGKRLHLAGRWWREKDDDDSKHHSTTVHVETLARHYCTSVEVSLRIV